jgi:poly-gamma-glutamate synthesis protein (capsule biosynthesis protein)
VELDRAELVQVEALPLKLDYCHTRVANGDDRAWIARRFLDACEALGARAEERADRLVIEY